MRLVTYLNNFATRNWNFFRDRNYGNSSLAHPPQENGNKDSGGALKQKDNLFRICIGYIKKKIDSFKLRHDEKSGYVACQTIYMMKHFLIKCNDPTFSRKPFKNIDVDIHHKGSGL